MAKDFPKVIFLKVNLRELEDLASNTTNNNISISPTSLFLKNGAKLVEFCGTDECQFRTLGKKHK